MQFLIIHLFIYFRCPSFNGITIPNIPRTWPQQSGWENEQTRTLWIPIIPIYMPSETERTKKEKCKHIRFVCCMFLNRLNLVHANQFLDLVFFSLVCVLLLCSCYHDCFFFFFLFLCAYVLWMFVVYVSVGFCCCCHVSNCFVGKQITLEGK